MEDILRDFKSFTSRKLRTAIEGNPMESRREWMPGMMYETGLENSNNRGFQLWQQHNHPIELATNEMMDQRLHYTHFNPVEAGFVSEPEDYLYSSARDYAREPGLLKIILLEEVLEVLAQADACARDGVEAQEDSSPIMKVFHFQMLLNLISNIYDKHIDLLQ